MDEEMKRELAGIKTHLAGVDKRLDGVDKRLDGVDKRLEGVDKRLDGIDRRLDTMDNDIVETKLAVRRVAIEQVKLKRQFDVFTDTVKMMFRQEFSKLRATLDDFLPLVEQARHDRSRNDKAFVRHQDRLDNHERRLARLEARPS